MISASLVRHVPDIEPTAAGSGPAPFEVPDRRRPRKTRSKWGPFGACRREVCHGVARARRRACIGARGRHSAASRERATVSIDPLIAEGCEPVQRAREIKAGFAPFAAVRIGGLRSLLKGESAQPPPRRGSRGFHPFRPVNKPVGLARGRPVELFVAIDVMKCRLLDAKTDKTSQASADALRGERA